MRILHITTVPMSLRFLNGQVGYMRTRGLFAHALSSPGTELEAFHATESVPTYAVPMTRQITPFRDLIAIYRIARVIRAIRPSIVHAHTPKGGLLGMLASVLCLSPARIYHMRGLPYLTAAGLRRRLLKLSEKVSCALAQRVLCNSRSIRMIVAKDRICSPHKITVLGMGSGNGVDAMNRFNPARMDPEIREKSRNELAIPVHATVIGFVGRVVKDKGIVELEEAWRLIRVRHPEAVLLIVGPFEEHDPLPAEVVDRLQNDNRVVLTGTRWNTPPLYMAMDLVVLPTYREGFPNVPLESSAMALPVVATNIPGCTDAVEDGVTGVLVPARDVQALTDAISAYVRNPQLRSIHGKSGRQRVLRDFRQEAIWEGILREYEKLVRSRRHLGVMKRAFDVMGSLLALVVLAPLMVLITIGVFVKLGRPVLFKQERIGYLGQPFRISKFRTMAEGSDEFGRPLPDQARIIPFGNFLRRTSLDELPELWNVLKGDMSLVGPRPLLPEYLPLYTSTQARRHQVRPGLTGWAQINGRNATTWERRLALDVWYVDNRNFQMDLGIILSTLIKVCRREGINQDGGTTMKRFRGTPDQTPI